MFDRGSDGIVGVSAQCFAKQASARQFMVAGMQLVYDHPAQTPDRQVNCPQAVHSTPRQLEEEAAAMVQRAQEGGAMEASLIHTEDSNAQ